jgi:hypothetical protein
MRTNRSRKPSAVVAVAALALVLGLQPTARGAGAPAPGGPSEGIKVIGEWTIVVRDEAGREVQRSEFRNALQSQGKPTLASLLSRGRAISEWAILLANGSGTVAGGQQPCGTPADGKSCGLAEQLSSQLPFADVDYVAGLSVASDPTDPSKMMLTGSRKATNSGGITTVSTMLSLCPPGPPSPSGCASTQDFRYFSGTFNFVNPPLVAAGQTIDVTVVFSFQ